MITRARFNEKLIRSLPFSEDDQPNIFGDTEVKALYLFCNKTKKTYRHIECKKGLRINDSVGDPAIDRLVDVRNKVIERQSAQANGSFQVKRQMIVSQAVDLELIPYYQNFVKDTQSALSCINRFTLRFFSDLPITAVTPEMAQEKVYILTGEGKAPETIRQLVLYAKKLYKKLIKRGLILVNPFDDLDLPKVSNIRNVTLTPEQRPDWFKCCIAENSIGADAVLFEYSEGTRVTETISIKVSDISKDFKTLTLPDTKSGKTQTRVISSVGQAILKRRVESTWNEWVFPSEKNVNSHIASPRGAFNRIKKRMTALGHDVTALTQHDLRRTNASACAEVTNGDVHMIAKQIRHSNPSILHRYVHYQSDAVAAVSEATAQALITPINEEEN